MPPKKAAAVVKAVVAAEKALSAPSSNSSAKKMKKKYAGRQVTGRDVGASLGGYVGSLAQKAIQTIMGQGDYTVSSNTLFSGSVRSSGPPKFVSITPGCTVIRHREYIKDVISSGAGFALTTVPINPTNPTTFPWLSNIANNFESYKFNGLVFEFLTNSATAVASTNTALGTVILATQYNIDDPPFASKLSMEQYEYAVSTVPFESAIHPVECKRDTGVLEYLYTYAAGSGDPRFSTFGNFSIATLGQQSSSNIGELWVSYDIELCKSRLTPFPSLYQFHATLTPTAPAPNLGYSTNLDMFTAPTGTLSLGVANNMPLTIGTAANGFPNSLVFSGVEAGVSLIIQLSTFTNAVAGCVWPAVSGTNMDFINIFPSAGGPGMASGYQIPNNGPVTNIFTEFISIRLRATAVGSPPVFSFGTAFTNLNPSTAWFDIWVTETTETS
jgi:hypothetical protein